MTLLKIINFYLDHIIATSHTGMLLCRNSLISTSFLKSYSEKLNNYHYIEYVYLQKTFARAIFVNYILSCEKNL